MRRLMIFFILFLSVSAGAQFENLEVVSFYPASAFVARRMIPFTVIGADGLKITRVELPEGNSCKSLIDPFYPKIFHVFCTKPDLVDVAVTVELDLDSFDYILTFNNLSIAERRAPGGELDSVTREEEAN